MRYDLTEQTGREEKLVRTFLAGWFLRGGLVLGSFLLLAIMAAGVLLMR